MHNTFLTKIIPFTHMAVTEFIPGIWYELKMPVAYTHIVFWCNTENGEPLTTAFYCHGGQSHLLRKRHFTDARYPIARAASVDWAEKCAFANTTNDYSWES